MTPWSSSTAPPTTMEHPRRCSAAAAHGPPRPAKRCTPLCLLTVALHVLRHACLAVLSAAGQMRHILPPFHMKKNSSKEKLLRSFMTYVCLLSILASLSTADLLSDHMQFVTHILGFRNHHVGTWSCAISSYKLRTLFGTGGLLHVLKASLAPNDCRLGAASSWRTLWCPRSLTLPSVHW